MSYGHLTPTNTPIVVVSWSDILFDDSWGDDDGEPVQPVESATVGYLLEDSPTVTVVASSYDYRSERWASIHAFPKALPEITIIKDQVPKQKRKR